MGAQANGRVAPAVVPSIAPRFPAARLRRQNEYAACAERIHTLAS
jgi:hypothetical protein